MSRTIAIIPARSGSKSILDKNLVDLGGYPLIAYSIAAAKLSRGVDRVIVSTDSSSYAEIATHYGAEVPFLRPAELSSDTSTDLDFMLHAMHWLEKYDQDEPEYWVHLRPTTPLREPTLIDNALLALKNEPQATALRSGHLSPESPFKWLRKNSDGFLVGLTSDDTDLDKYNLPRQAYPDVYIPDGYVDVVKRSFVMTANKLHGDRVLAFESPYCTEVDSIEELELLSFQISKVDSPLTEYLRGIN